jgi:hypothetical protein
MIYRNDGESMGKKSGSADVAGSASLAAVNLRETIDF